MKGKLEKLKAKILLFFYLSLLMFSYSHIRISCLKLSAQSFSLMVYCLEFVVFSVFLLRSYGLLLYFVGLCIYKSLVFTRVFIGVPDVKIHSHP